MVNNLVCDIINYINENINDKISIEELTQEFNYNRYYIMKLFKRELDISIINYINCIRIYNSLNSLRSILYMILKTLIMLVFLKTIQQHI